MAMARKWQKMAGIGRRREISLPNARNTRLADKGHFVVYSMDKRRFMVPLAYLSSSIFIELLRMSEEEFGLPGDGPITLPLMLRPWSIWFQWLEDTSLKSWRRLCLFHWRILQVSALQLLLFTED
ncbi:Auxin-responsive protein SAUR66 [Vitis vinifera]|uniref:Auxin-responsive protein SAUR66 n=1 Tax=Vitis vinifera TaxID=29760 RepID=A0A438ETA6_VITVI|nr:Auxin-responsive protein SAUR66 [Vitis vinifera]